MDGAHPVIGQQAIERALWETLDLEEHGFTVFVGTFNKRLARASWSDTANSENWTRWAVWFAGPEVFKAADSLYRLGGSRKAAGKLVWVAFERAAAFRPHLRAVEPRRELYDAHRTFW